MKNMLSAAKHIELHQNRGYCFSGLFNGSCSLKVWGGEKNSAPEKKPLCLWQKKLCNQRFRGTLPLFRCRAQYLERGRSELTFEPSTGRRQTQSGWVGGLAVSSNCRGSEKERETGSHLRNGAVPKNTSRLTTLHRPKTTCGNVAALDNEPIVRSLFTNFRLLHSALDRL